jgi:hypothetical protein
MDTTAFTSPNAFTNAEAQDFAFELRPRGLEAIDEVLNQKGRSDAHAKRVIAAGETVAAANGYPPTETGWCTSIEKWLFESEYTPDQATVEQCANRIERLIDKAATIARLGIPVEQLADLLTRLRRPTRKIKRRLPKPDRKAFRELVKWLNTSTGEADPGTRFDRQGSATVYLYHVTAQAACRLVNYRKVRGLELPLNESNEPRELAAALRILLREWSSTLEYLLIHDIPDATAARNRPKCKTLISCAAEFANLPALEKFVAQRVFFDDDLLSSVCQNTRLADIQISYGEVTRQAIAILEQCHSLNRIYINRCPKFPYMYRDELAARCSHAKHVAVGRK